MDLLAPARAGFSTLLGLGTAVRGARVFHPRGHVRACRVVVEPTGPAWGAALLDQPAVHEGVVRLSRGLGLPEPLPDVDGLALRLPGLGREGAPLDLLVNSAWRFVFVPSLLSSTWSAVLPHRTGTGRVLLLGARPQPGGFALLAAAPLGPWRPWGRLELGGPQDLDLRTDPTVGAQDLFLTGPFVTLRRMSYAASQAAR